MTAAQRERHALVDTMRAVGPDAPTLCGAWTTRDLAAHLVVREGRPDTTPGIMIPFLAGYTERVRRQAAADDWELPTWEGGGRVHPDVDLNSNASIQDFLDRDLPIEKLR